MPYIKRKRRNFIDKSLGEFFFQAKIGRFSEGDLNYLITKILLETRPEHYEDYNALIGVLECCKQEFYRRAVSVYEDKKIEENSDVYGKG